MSAQNINNIAKDDFSNISEDDFPKFTEVDLIENQLNEFIEQFKNISPTQRTLEQNILINLLNKALTTNVFEKEMKSYTLQTRKILNNILAEFKTHSGRLSKLENVSTILTESSKNNDIYKPELKKITEDFKHCMTECEKWRIGKNEIDRKQQEDIEILKNNKASSQEIKDLTILHEDNKKTIKVLQDDIAILKEKSVISWQKISGVILFVVAIAGIMSKLMFSVLNDDFVTKEYNSQEFSKIQMQLRDISDDLKNKSKNDTEKYQELLIAIKLLEKERNKEK